MNSTEITGSVHLYSTEITGSVHLYSIEVTGSVHLYCTVLSGPLRPSLPSLAAKWPEPLPAGEQENEDLRSEHPAKLLLRVPISSMMQIFVYFSEKTLLDEL